MANWVSVQEGTVRRNFARIAIATIVLLGLVLFFFFFVANGGESEAPSTTAQTTNSEIVGSWAVERSSVDPGSDEVRADGFNQSFAGYRISLLGDLPVVVVGRTTEVSGELQVSNGAADLQLQIDAATFNSGDEQTDSLISETLETSDNSEITFSLNEPIFLDPGTTSLEGTALGELTIATESQPTKISYRAQLLTDTGVLADFTDADKLVQVAISAEIDIENFGLDTEALELTSTTVMLEGLLNFVPVSE